MTAEARSAEDGVVVRAAPAAELPRVEGMWRALYDLQREQGMTMTLPDNAFALWETSMKGTMGRFTNLFVADAGDTAGPLSGFLAARVRGAPAWFGGAAVGFVSEVWVSPAARGARVGERLVRAAEAWFRASGIARVELQVMMKNDPARRLYAKLGWVEELAQVTRAL